ncbi:Phosphotransferase enzyme family, putative [Synechococcus sp. PCC 7335]|uniref:phosphotransferase family protein n=1 Tax=Synechococcus sp. (strain ATCC 29403 / PCC 7335) TaxID=91464 RepID=UPI00017EBCDE|nr:phosphotransferase [Synechococcus sp. PCC 7335]EDX82755.1 Phosphotransferase enzyme family, putative [Synechococcus sp. PCC 7335]
MVIPATYLERIAQIYPAQTFNEIVFNQDGMVNDVVILDGRIVCRFPKHDWAFELLQQEARVISLVSRHVDLQVPQFETVEKDAATYRYIEGIPLSREVLFSLPLEDRNAVMSELGLFLRQLHAIPISEAEKVGIHQSDTNRSTQDWQDFYTDVEEALFPLLMRHQRSAIASHFEPVLSDNLDMDYRPAFINGDIGCYHILFNKEKKALSGIIDFGTAGIGDPATDIAVLLGQYGETLLELMLSGYPSASQYMERARFWAGTFELQWALTGVKNDNKELLLAHLGGARDRLPLCQ